jgi:hypothetical protein
MTAAGHLSCAFLVKTKFKEVPFWILLLSTEAIELVWVFLNLNPFRLQPPIEITKINEPFLFIGDMQLIQQFVSHSLLGAILIGILIGLLFKKFFPVKGIFIAIILATMSHWVLDLIVHDKDLPILISNDSIKVGALLNFDSSKPDLGFYTTAPILGFLFQFLFSFICIFLYLKNFPLEKNKLKFWIITISLNLFVIGIFIKGIMGFMIQSAQIFIIFVLVDIIITALLYLYCSKFTKQKIV